MIDKLDREVLRRAAAERTAIVFGDTPVEVRTCRADIIAAAIAAQDIEDGRHVRARSPPHASSFETPGYARLLRMRRCEGCGVIRPVGAARVTVAG